MDKGKEDLFSKMFSKLLNLEKSMKVFQAEMDIKMKIIEKLLSFKNEQFVVMKQLMDKEYALYNIVLDHWKNTGNLAENGLSIDFTSDDSETVTVEAELSPRTKKSPSAVRRDRKRRMLKKNLTGSSILEESGLNSNNICNDNITNGEIIIADVNSDLEQVTENNDIKYTGFYEENLSDPDYDPFNSEGATKKPKTCTKRSNVKRIKRVSEIWNYFKREGTGKVWCNDCQRILLCSKGKGKGGISNSTIKRHLKNKHPISFQELCKAKAEVNNSNLDIKADITLDQTLEF